ncbi:MAG TPA: hypothetical protein VEW42_06285, partial [Candidatus Eisenbacteria bacterium]|nr:hypothetical protein [Candidatus Eisenbacteria bacterium]
AASLFENPQSVVIPNQKVSSAFSEEIKTKFTTDPVVQRYPEKYNPERFLQLIASRTATSPEDATQKAREYIASGYRTPTNQSAMLDIIADMLNRKDTSQQKNKRQPARITS